MSASKGPWKLGVRQPNSSRFIYGPSGEEIADADRLTNFPDTNLANARLIAAAPSLLEALKGLLEIAHADYQGDPDPSEMDIGYALGFAEEAVRLAEGGEP